ncbi:MAG: cadherin-like domain-containing protein [Gemmatimonadaceae bacterium]|nr:cadherin-like domain-containing protein [Chitinophagaceae bacterium]
MKRISFLLAAMAVLNGAIAQTNDNFNSRPEAALNEVKPFLQEHCWQFSDFEINRAGWTPGIEGDGAMVSGPGNSPTGTTGIYSQMLTMGGNAGISFKYKFNSNVTDRRWVRVLLLDKNNVVVSKLDSVELTGSSSGTVYNYNKNFNVGSGCFKIYINYRGSGGSARIAVDELNFTNNTYYAGGCNQAPVAVNDNIAGKTNRTAAGNVLPNDYDPNNELLSVQLIAASPDGTVTLEPWGSFVFTPYDHFKGTSTVFSYLTCDDGASAMCSNSANVTLNFPIQGSLPVSIIDFTGMFNNEKVTIKWTTTFELKNDYFEIERSTDGVNFKKVGSVKGVGNSSVKHDYKFDDNVKSSVASRNDLYYRLREVDVDGNDSYSKVLIVRVYQTKSLQSVSVTPNPAVNDIRVSVQLNENAFVVMKVMNSSGVEVLRKSQRAANGSNSFAIEGSSQLKPGVYMLEVLINSNERMIVKLIKS